MPGKSKYIILLVCLSLCLYSSSSSSQESGENKDQVNFNSSQAKFDQGSTQSYIRDSARDSEQDSEQNLNENSEQASYNNFSNNSFNDLLKELLGKSSSDDYIKQLRDSENFDLFGSGQKDQNYSQEDNKENNKGEEFLNQLKLYRPNAFWITQEFMTLTADQLSKSFCEVIKLLADKNFQHIYFDIKEKLDQDILDDYKFNKRCIWQCEIYHKWLKNVYVNILEPNGKPYFRDRSIQLNNDFVKLTDHWHETGQEETLKAYMQFYAFFFDCLSREFYWQISYAYKVINDLNEFGQSTELIDKLYANMEELILKISEFKDQRLAKNYITNFKRYESVIMTLKQEYHKNKNR